MKATRIHSKPGLVDVFWDEEMKAVCLKWHSEWDEGTGVRDAVTSALKYVNENRVQNWLADISTSRRGLTPDDMAWVSGPEFTAMIRNSSLRRFVLIPPLPETGQDTDWLAHWEKNTLAAFGEGTKARLASDMDEIRAFYAS